MDKAKKLIQEFEQADSVNISKAVEKIESYLRQFPLEQHYQEIQNLIDEMVLSNYRYTIFRMAGLIKYLIEERRAIGKELRKAGISNKKKKGRGRKPKYDKDFAIKVNSRLKQSDFENNAETGEKEKIELGNGLQLVRPAKGNQQDKIQFIQQLYKLSGREKPDETTIREYIGDK